MAGTRLALRRRVVFVAGSSYSGSTLLGLVLGADPRAFFVGEPKQIVWLSGRDPLAGKPGRLCTCGQSPKVCPFWSAVRARYGADARSTRARGFSLANLRILLRTLSPLPLRWQPRDGMDYASLLEAISGVARKHKPGVEFVVDGSKSIRSLDALAGSPRLDLAVVHIVRDCVAVADSYRDRGFSALYGALAWAVVNLFLRFYVWRRRLPVLLVSYEDLCRSPERELGRLNRFLGTTLATGEVPASVRRESYHLFSGNNRVREAIRDFGGIEIRPDRGHLGRFERLAAIGVRVLVHRVARIPVRAAR